MGESVACGDGQGLILRGCHVWGTRRREGLFRPGRGLLMKLSGALHNLLNIITATGICGLQHTRRGRKRYPHALLGLF